jgi:hypothetical protein
MNEEEFKFQTDLGTLIARLEQIESEGYANGHWLLDRIITCDLPRLKQYLTPWMQESVRRVKGTEQNVKSHADLQRQLFAPKSVDREPPPNT